MVEQTFPDLFTEACDMLVLSILIFVVADLRRLVRKGELESDVAEEVLHLPLQGSQFFSILSSNKDALKNKVRSNEYRTLEYILEKNIVDSRDLWESGELHHFGDENPM